MQRISRVSLVYDSDLNHPFLQIIDRFPLLDYPDTALPPQVHKMRRNDVITCWHFDNEYSPASLALTGIAVFGECWKQCQSV